MILQPVVDIAEICAKKGIRKAIICPGSRNAPLTLAFSRHPDIDCLSVPDERSAAFIGLGIALKTDLPVVLICTSGSAVYNFAPAVAEAHFAQVPLLVLTADRPKEWIGQYDGQTIYQDNIFGKHVKAAHTFPTNYEQHDCIWHAHRITNEAINAALEFPPGPTHINIPLQEPFYPEDDEIIDFSDNIKVIDSLIVETKEFKLNEDLYDAKKVLIIGGQTKYDSRLTAVLSDLSEQLKIPVIADIISNLHDVKRAITTHDAFLKDKSQYHHLKPDLIITFGKSVISKNLKLFLRQVQPQEHWHIQPYGNAADTFKSLTKIIRCEPIQLFSSLVNENKSSSDPSFFDLWNKKNQRTASALAENLKESVEFSEFRAFKEVLKLLPNGVDVHLANSMAVRYANFLGLNSKKNIEVFVNRGTSGIDGSVSTAVGAALSTNRDVYLLIGDMAFFYDRNGFWHNHIPPNLKIVVFNNHGGGIFRMIDGPSKQPELEEFFETKQKLTAKNLTDEFGFGYFNSQTEEQLFQGIEKMQLSADAPFILEIETDSVVNKKVYKQVIGTLSQFN